MKKQSVTELLTLSEASQALKVHPNTLRKWDRKGILKAGFAGHWGWLPGLRGVHQNREKRPC